MCAAACTKQSRQPNAFNSRRSAADRAQCRTVWACKRFLPPAVATRAVNGESCCIITHSIASSAAAAADRWSGHTSNTVLTVTSALPSSHQVRCIHSLRPSRTTPTPKPYYISQGGATFKTSRDSHRSNAEVFCVAKMHRIHFRPGVRWGAHDAPLPMQTH